MIAKVFSRTIDKNVQAYYLICDGRTYFLFSQQYHHSNAEIFNRGITIDQAFGLKSNRSESVRRAAAKLPAKIRGIERENNIVVLNRTKKRYGLIA